jgi:hypothetical protein
MLFVGQFQAVKKNLLCKKIDKTIVFAVLKKLLLSVIAERGGFPLL